MSDRIKGGVIEFVCEGGFGSEANVKIELRKIFPGLGGTILTRQGVQTALREEFNPKRGVGHQLFLRHALIKKLDDYFFHLEKYAFAHIPRPLGSMSAEGKESYEAYLYEWAFGTDEFAWETVDRNHHIVQVQLRDWGVFTSCFREFGIDLGKDCTQADSGGGKVSQNIVHQFPRLIGEEKTEFCSFWKRIDFGFGSIRIDHQRLHDCLREKAASLVDVLGVDRYEMMLLISHYINPRQELNYAKRKQIEFLIGDYRRSTLDHFRVQEFMLSKQQVL